MYVIWQLEQKDLLIAYLLKGLVQIGQLLAIAVVNYNIRNYGIYYDKKYLIFIVPCSVLSFLNDCNGLVIG